MFSKIKGLVFDLDDTIVETEQLNVELISSYFKKKWKVSLDYADKEIVFGHSWKHIYAFIASKYNLPVSIHDVQSAIVEMKRDHLTRNTLTAATGLDVLCRLPLKRVILSGSGREEIEMILENIKLSHCFDKIISADDYKKGKPDSEGFFAALDYLDLTCDETLAFEDAKSGIEAARKAGIMTVFIKEFAKDDCSTIADFSFENFKAFYKQFLKSFKG